jgi:hypothetical protein
VKIRWTTAARHYLQVIAFCCVIAVLTTAIWPNKSYLWHTGYSLLMGTVTWAVIEFGAHLFDDRHCHIDPLAGYRWAKGWRGVLLVAVGIGCGSLANHGANALLLDDAIASRDLGLSLLITAIAGVGASLYFYLSAKIGFAEREASEARLKLLESQLEPHMLFNTFANLRALIASDPPRAVEMLDHLNDYLRVTLSGSRSVSHPLSREFDRLRDYLELMAPRMGPRLRYTLDLPEDLRHQSIPPLLLQPLVENSIRHGLEPKIEGGEISVRARREGTQLLIEVIDTGVGIDAAAAASGFGLAQVRERLHTVYGPQSALSITPLATGTRAAIRIPLPA